MTTVRTRGIALAVIMMLSVSLGAATISLAPVSLYATTDEEDDNDSGSGEEQRERANNSDDYDTDEQDRDENSDDGKDSDDREDETEEENGEENRRALTSSIKMNDDEPRVVESDVNSENAAVEISHELTQTVQQGGAARELAHEGGITFTDEDGELVREINTNSAPQSSGAASSSAFLPTTKFYLPYAKTNVQGGGN